MSSRASSPLDCRPVVISGPSGVGKGTLCQKLLDTHPNTFAATVSHTTRRPRPGEIDGVNYSFVTPTTFASLLSQNGFVEHTVFNGNYYGTSKQTILDQTAKGLVVILEVEMEGVKQIRANSAVDARFVFISPPSFEVLEERLRSRATEAEEDIQKRLAQARAEIEFSKVQGVYDKIVINDNLEKAHDELCTFILGVSS